MSQLSAFCLSLALGFFLTPVASFAATRSNTPAAKQPIDYVDPFIGTGGEGNVYPGVAVPFGFIQVGPDTVAPRQRRGRL